MTDDIKKELDQIGNLVDSKIEKAMESAKDNAKGEVNETLKSEIDHLTSQITEKHDEVQKRMDSMEVTNKKLEAKSKSTLNLKDALRNAINDGAIDSLKKGQSRASSFEIKADMTTGADYTGEVIAATRVPGFKYDPSNTTHVRQMVPTGTTNSDLIRYVSESAYTQGAAATAEGAALSQTDFNLTASTAPIETVGTYLRLSRQMLADTEQLTSYISARVPSKLMAVEDDQLLGGSGVAPNLHGLRNTGTAWSNALSGFAAGVIGNPQQFDVLLTAINQLAKFNYTADYILVNPTDFHKILALKDSDNRYLKDQVYNGLQPNFMGVPVMINTAMAADEFIVGNFSTGAQLWVRENVSVEFFEQDSDNVQKNFITVRVQERIGFTTYLPNAFCRGAFSTVIAAL
jgi:HK97 family phage major capsid protein